MTSNSMALWHVCVDTQLEGLLHTMDLHIALQLLPEDKLVVGWAWGPPSWVGVPMLPLPHPHHASWLSQDLFLGQQHWSMATLQALVHGYLASSSPWLSFKP